MDKNINIIIIEDNEALKDTSLIWELEEIYKKVYFFTNPDEALEFISNNFTKHLIVLLDIDFPENTKNGHQILEELRGISFNIPVVLWSGINEYKESFSDFINNKVNGYIKKDATSEEALKIINNVANNYQVNIEHSLEEWISQHPQMEKNKQIFKTSEGKSYSLNDILIEIQMQTSIGKEFSKRLSKLTIDLLMRNIETLND
ncbi:MAG: response regulator [Ignavibacteriae bacterium]|nr:response regulator [Ignavibacteriota bacterium]